MSAKTLSSRVWTDIVIPISHEWLGYLDETYREYSLAAIDGLI